MFKIQIFIVKGKSDAINISGGCKSLIGELAKPISKLQAGLE